MAALPKLVAHAQKNAPGFARILTGVKPKDINSRKALATLPVTRKSDLGALQKEMPPLGGLNATPVEKLGKLFVSPGPIYDPEGRGSNWWRPSMRLCICCLSRCGPRWEIYFRMRCSMPSSCCCCAFRL